MADKLQDTAPAVQNKTALREEILKNIEKKVANDPALRDLSNKFGEDVKKLINETTNFYSGLGVALTADQLGDQILKTKFPKYNPKNQTPSQTTANPMEKNIIDRKTNPSNQEALKKITPKSEDLKNIDPYRERPENNPSAEKTEKSEQNKRNEENFETGFPSQQNNITKISPISSSQTKEREEERGNEQNLKEESQMRAGLTNSNKSSSIPQKINSNSGNRGREEKEGENGKEFPKTGQKNDLNQNFKNIRNVFSQNKNPKKLSLAIWTMLGLGAVMIDFAQGALAPTLLALIVNMLADIFIGLALFTFFWFHKMLNRKLIISLLLGFLVDFVSFGIMPAWSFDIAYAWFVTDGASVVSKVPGVGEKTEELAQKIISKKV